MLGSIQIGVGTIAISRVRPDAEFSQTTPWRTVRPDQIQMVGSVG